MWQAAIVSFKLKIVAFNKLSMPPPPVAACRCLHLSNRVKYQVWFRFSQRRSFILRITAYFAL
jgi:hypothetical protein